MELLFIMKTVVHDYVVVFVADEDILETENVGKFL
jgi:hypothetical protein